MVRRLPVPLLAAALLAAFLTPRPASAAAVPTASEGPYKAFWLTEALTGRTVGPLVNRPGNRFDAGGARWVVIQSEKPGEIDFADVETLTRQGPYDLVEQRLLELGPKAYVFTRIEDFGGDDPTADRSVVSQAVRAGAGTGAGAKRHDWSGEVPERWVLGPVPSTNPRAHKDYVSPWTLSALRLAPSVLGFIEPMRSVQYDWELGGYQGGHKKTVDAVRLGVQGEWNGFSGEFGVVSGAKTTGSLVRDSVSLSSLRFADGDGWFVQAGWDWRFQIEGGWSASIGARASHERISGTLSARTTRLEKLLEEAADGSGATNEVSSWNYRDWSHDATLSETRVTAVAAIRYDEWYWGVGVTFLLDCVSDTSLDADVPVLGRDYSLDTDRSQPVGLRFGGWYSPLDHWMAEASVVVGSETTLRLAAGWFF